MPDSGKREARRPDTAEAPITDTDLEGVPYGALALAGTAVALLLAAWFIIYFFAFLARGPVG